MLRVRSPRLAFILAALTLPLAPSRGQAADPLGATIATTGIEGTVACASCHGVDGLGNAAAGFPSLAGQDAGYLTRQLQLIRDGARAAAVMAPTLGQPTDAQLAAVAAYYAALPAPTGAAESLNDVQRAAAEALVQVGDWSARALPACVSCHGPGARGVNASFPGIAGQHAPYLEAQLRAWARGERATDPGDLMGTVARKLTDTEITAVSAWLAAQPGEAE